MPSMMVVIGCVVTRVLAKVLQLVAVPCRLCPPRSSYTTSSACYCDSHRVSASSCWLSCASPWASTEQIEARPSTTPAASPQRQRPPPRGRGVALCAGHCWIAPREATPRAQNHRSSRAPLTVWRRTTVAWQALYGFMNTAADVMAQTLRQR